MSLLAAAVVGMAIGFLGGLFGKGGSAVATPLLAAVGVPPIVAVASPLPATIPSTVAAGSVYRKAQLIDARVVRWSVAFGAPATIAGAVATRWIDGSTLVSATDAVLVVMGVRFLLARPADDGAATRPRRDPGWLLATVALGVGLVSGLLANSGGFLLAPLYVIVLRLPLKVAFASSLAVAAVLAVPGTVVHVALGHVDWALVAVFGAGSMPLSLAGARVALRTRADRLERLYGAAVSALGLAFLIAR